MINKVLLIGRLGKDPEIRAVGESKVANFSLATDESYKDKNGEWQNKAEWHNIVAWRNAANTAETRLKKGSLVYIEGKLTTRKWTTQDGVDKYTTEVVAYTLRPLEKSEAKQATQQFSEPQLAQADDDLPF